MNQPFPCVPTADCPKPSEMGHAWWHSVYCSCPTVLCVMYKWQNATYILYVRQSCSLTALRARDQAAFGMEVWSGRGGGGGGRRGCSCGPVLTCAGSWAAGHPPPCPSQLPLPQWGRQFCPTAPEPPLASIWTQGNRVRDWGARLAAPAVLVSPRATQTVPGIAAQHWAWGCTECGKRDGDGVGRGHCYAQTQRGIQKSGWEQHMNALICSACGGKLQKLLTHLPVLCSYTWRESGGCFAWKWEIIHEELNKSNCSFFFVVRINVASENCSPQC